MDKKQLTALAEGRFELAFARCELRQRGTDEPHVLIGSGFLAQDHDGALLLRMAAHDERTDVQVLKMKFSQSWAAGQLIPEAAYYDLIGWTVDGTEWQAERVSPSMDYGMHGTAARIRLRRVETKEQWQHRAERATVTVSIPEELDLPWHEWTSTSQLSGAVNKFRHDTGQFSWLAHKANDQTTVGFSVEGENVEPAFTYFWRALSIVLGRLIEPQQFSIAEGLWRISRLASRSNSPHKRKLAPPVRGLRPDADDTHAFIRAFLEHSTREPFETDVDGEGGHSELIYRHWHRILRAWEKDLENSALVLSVAIEALIKETFANEHDVDAEFIAQLDRAKPILKKAALDERARNCVLASIGNARTPRVGDVLRRLVDQGGLHDGHVKAWSALRNSSAHGGTLADDDLALQIYIDRFHVCLDLFYRLVFLIIGYRGHHRDYSVVCSPAQQEWPIVPFPPVPPPTASEGDATLRSGGET